MGPIFYEIGNDVVLLNVERGRFVVLEILSLLDDEPDN
jgi:hypothetical protein